MTTAVCDQDRPSFVDLFGSGTASAFQDLIILPTMIPGFHLDKDLFPLGWTASVRRGFLVEYEIQSSIDVIQRFATKLLENTKDIDPAFARIAKDSFWDLI